MTRVSMALMATVVLVFAGMVATADAASPVVDNVQANQREGTTGANAIVDITYDMQDDSATVGITIEVSNDGGTTFDVPALNLHRGCGYSRGRGREERGVASRCGCSRGVLGQLPGEGNCV